MRTASVLVWIKGAGDLGTGTAHRLHRAGFQVIMTELAQPTVIRRAVSFASAVYEQRLELENVEAGMADSAAEANRLLAKGVVPVLVDPLGICVKSLHPSVLVDARLTKRNLDTHLEDAGIVIGLGPGFTAAKDVHAVVETNRGHHLGRVILEGSAQQNTGVPGLIDGYGLERVLWAPCAGRFSVRAQIGQRIEAGETVAHVGRQPVDSSIAGVLRGILYDGLDVVEGQKVGDVDPRGLTEHCFTISDKARAVGGAVLEAILYLQRHLTST